MSHVSGAICTDARSQFTVVDCVTPSVKEVVMSLLGDSKRLVWNLMGTASNGTTPSAGATGSDSSASQTIHTVQED